ncbi:MAG TPA: PIN domain-containing protein [Pyrinomonadaceae bacterium]
MKIILVDTHYLIAIINRLDQWHQSAISVISKLDKAKLVVTESVLVETLNYFAEFRLEAKQHAAETIESFSANINVEVVEQTSKIFLEGMKFYKSRLDKGYSLTDCISMNVCRELSIMEILTYDHHFEQEGFKILL